MPPIASTSPRSIASAIGGEPGKPRTILNLVPMRSLSAVGMNEELLEGTLAAMMICRCLASWIDCTAEVCHTMASVAVDTMRPIHVSLTGSNSPGPPSTLPSVKVSRNSPSEVPSCGVMVEI